MAARRYRVKPLKTAELRIARRSSIFLPYVSRSSGYLLVDRLFPATGLHSDGSNPHGDVELLAQVARGIERDADGLRAAARLRFVVKVIITDGGDHTNFVWEYGKGITYPPDAAGEG